MAITVRAGTATVPSSGNLTISTPGMTPRFVLLMTASASASGTWVNSIDHGLGAWAVRGSGASTARSSRSVGLRSTNGGASASVVKNGSTQQLRDGDTWETDGIFEASGQFTLEFVSPRPPTGTLIHWLAIGGDAAAALQGSVVSAVLPTGRAAGATFSQVVSGGGQGNFLILFAYSPNTATGKPCLSFGVVDQSLNQWSLSWEAENGVNPTDTARRLDSSHGLHAIDDAGATIWNMRVTSIGNGTFSYVHDVPPTTNNDGNFSALFVSGNILSAAGVVAKPTGAAPAAQTIATRFVPQGAILATHADTALDTAVASARGSIGFSDLTNHTAMAWQDNDAVTPADAHGVSRNDAALIKANNATETEEARATAAAGTGGLAVTWNPNDAVATQFGYLILSATNFTFDATLTGDSALVLDRIGQPVMLFPNAIVGGSAIAPLQFGATAFLDALLDGSSDLASALALTAKLEAVLAGDAALAVPGISKTISLASTIAGDAALALDLLRGDKDLGLVSLTGEAALLFTSLTLARPLSAVLASGSDLLAYFRYILPTLRQATASEYPGTINMMLNPGFEDGSTTNWITQGAATIVTETGRVWEGARSARIVMPGAAAGEGLAIRSVAGTDLTGLSPTTGTDRYVIGSLYYYDLPAQMEVWSRAVYTDASIVEGNRQPLDAFTGSAFLRAVAPPLALDPAKSLQYVETLLTSTTAQAGTWYADGGQLEEDRGEGVTPWTSGALGNATGRWHTLPNKSVSIRDPLPLLLRASSRGGVVTIEAQLWRATWDGQLLEDISDALKNATVSMDPDRDITWNLDASMTWLGYRDLRPTLDWLVPTLKVTHPDGSVREGRLGLYLMIPSEVVRREYDAEVTISAFDPLWLLDQQGFTIATAPVGSVGQNRLALVRQIMLGATLSSEGQVIRTDRFTLPSGGPAFVDAEDWSLDDSRLQIMNDILEGAGAYTLATNAHGIISTRLRTTEQLKDRAPVRTWAGNVPENVNLDARIPSGASLPSEIVGAVRTTPLAFDQIDQIVLVADRTSANPTTVSAQWQRPYVIPQAVFDRHHDDRGSHYLDFLAKRQPRPRIIHCRRGMDPATIPEVATSLADELSARTQRVKLGVLPDPSVDYLRETVLLAVWDRRGDPVAVGQFAVLNARWGFTPKSCIQQMEVGFVDAAGTQIVTEVVQ